MYRLEADLSGQSDDESSDSVASGGKTSRREKPSAVTSQKPLQLRQNRPRSPMPYTRGRYSMSPQSSGTTSQSINPSLLPPITSSPGMVVLQLNRFQLDARLLKPHRERVLLRETFPVTHKLQYSQMFRFSATISVFASHVNIYVRPKSCMPSVQTTFRRLMH